MLRLFAFATFASLASADLQTADLQNECNSGNTASCQALCGLDGADVNTRQDACQRNCANGDNNACQTLLATCTC